jgi:hypothetical protein
MFFFNDDFHGLDPCAAFFVIPVTDANQGIAIDIGKPLGPPLPRFQFQSRLHPLSPKTTRIRPWIIYHNSCFQKNILLTLPIDTFKGSDMVAI